MNDHAHEKATYFLNFLVRKYFQIIDIVLLENNYSSVKNKSGI